MMRRFEHDHLVATDAGSPIGQRAGARRIDRNRRAAAIEHNKVVAETVHFEERDLAHWRRLYGGAHRPVQRWAAPAKVPAAAGPSGKNWRVVRAERFCREFCYRKPLARARPGHPRLKSARISAPKTWMAGPSSDCSPYTPLDTADF